MATATVKLPTPPVVSGAGFFGMGHGLGFLRDPLELLDRGYREHGRVFSLKMGLNRLAMLVGPEHNSFFFQETDKSLSIRHGYKFFARMFSDRLYFLADHQEYQEQRNFVVPMFKGNQLKTYIPVMEEEVERLMETMGERGELELNKTFGTLVMNIAVHSFLGREFRDHLGDEFFEIFRDFSEGTDPVLPGWLPLPHFRRSRKARARLHATLQGVIDSRRQAGDPPQDFLQKLIDGSYTDGQKIPDKVIIDLILLFSWAGHETTAGHTSWAIVDLLQHPEYLERIRDEQREVLGPQPGRLEMDQIRGFTLLNWALKETERVHPVAFLLIRKAMKPLEVAGFRIPKGWLVAISPWLTHHLEELYRDPLTWDPDRFSPERGEKMAHLVGFGGGVHKCAGINFAYLEMKVILSLLLRRYELTLVDKDPQPIKGSHTKWPASPCRVQYQRIKSPVAAR